MLGIGKTKEAADLLWKLSNKGRAIQLAEKHRRKVFELAKGCGETRKLEERSVDVSFVQSQILEYTRADIHDNGQVLALIIAMCTSQVASQEVTLYFPYIGCLVELLKSRNSPFYRGALLIYQSALFEKGNKDGAFDILFSLPIVSVVANKSDPCHAKSAWLKGCAYEVVGRNTEAIEAYKEINSDNNDPWVYKVRAKNRVEILEGGVIIVEEPELEQEQQDTNREKRGDVLEGHEITVEEPNLEQQDASQVKREEYLTEEVELLRSDKTCCCCVIV